jgi:LEM-3-like GIY-YIG domain
VTAIVGGGMTSGKLSRKIKRNLSQGGHGLSNIKKDFYVYQYVNRHTGVPFYVGKGKNYRSTSHLNEARKTSTNNPKLNMIRKLNFEEGVEIEVIKKDLEESRALALEAELIRKIGRKELNSGPLLNRSNGGEGLSGGVDPYGYKRTGIARFITDMVHSGEFVQNMPKLVRQYVRDNNMTVKWVENRIISHVQEMGNVGCHYKGPKITLCGWQFSLNGKMIDVNNLTLETHGFLKVHGDLPFNEGVVTKLPEDYIVEVPKISTNSMT